VPVSPFNDGFCNTGAYTISVQDSDPRGATRSLSPGMNKDNAKQTVDALADDDRSIGRVDTISPQPDDNRHSQSLEREDTPKSIDRGGTISPQPDDNRHSRSPELVDNPEREQTLAKAKTLAKGKWRATEGKDVEEGSMGGTVGRNDYTQSSPLEERTRTDTGKLPNSPDCK
jgi:hypothetical protein